MSTSNSSGDQALHDIAERHGFGADAARSMLDALIAGRGSMAQFDHPEFGGSGQWMRGGMTMVSDLFDNTLRSRVDALCQDLAALAESQGDRAGTVSAQSRLQSSGEGTPRGPFASSSVGHWWPAGLGSPDSTGTQNGARYAWFAQAARLAIDLDGHVTVYDTQDHRIGGFSQAQSSGSSMGFHSQHGEVDVEKLPVVSRSDAARGDADRGPGDVATRRVPGEGDGPQDEAGVARAVERAASSAEPVTHGADPAVPTPSFVARPSIGSGPSASAMVPTIPRSPSAGASQPSAGAASAAGRPASHPSPTDADVFALIEKLAALHAKGALTDDEFRDKKADLLGRI